MELKGIVRIVAPLLLLSSCAPSPKPLVPSVPAPAAPVALDPVQAAQLAVQKAPSFENFTALGLAFSSRGNHEEALNAFERSLATSSRAPLALNNICSQQNELKRWRLAIEACQKALELEPGYLLAKSNLAFAQRANVAQELKIADLEKAVKSEKNPDRTRIELGMELYHEGDYARAAEAWNQVPEKSENFAVAQNNLATVYILTKKFDLAKSSLDRALAREPGNQLYLNNQKWLQSAQAAR